MRVYKNKEELKVEINKMFWKYISEFDDIPEILKDISKKFLELIKSELD